MKTTTKRIFPPFCQRLLVIKIAIATWGCHSIPKIHQMLSIISTKLNTRPIPTIKVISHWLEYPPWTCNLLCRKWKRWLNLVVINISTSISCKTLSVSLWWQVTLCQVGNSADLHWLRGEPPQHQGEGGQELQGAVQGSRQCILCEGVESWLWGMEG